MARAAAMHSMGSLLVDLADNDANNLSRPSRWKPLLEFIPFSLLIGIDLPCATWSMARRAPQSSSMPSPLRGAGEHLWGLPSLSDKDQQKVHDANHQLRGAVRLIRRSIAECGTGYLENPASSRVWKVPSVIALIASGRAELLCFDQCQYGTAWRKRTRFLVWGKLRGLILNRCSGKGGMCSRSGRPHLQLTGASGGQFRSSHAQVFTLELGSAVFQHLMSHKC